MSVKAPGRKSFAAGMHAQMTKLPTQRQKSADKDDDNAAGTSSNIQVAVRARPLNSMERNLSSKMIFKASGTTLEELEDDGYTPSGKTYTYDNVFGPECSNEDVYNGQCKAIVTSALQGYNGTIFAYGQTSSGKTFTLMGDVQTCPGVMPLSISDVFQWVGEHPHIEWEVYVSFISIYNEEISDLLERDQKKGSKLKIVDDKVTGPWVKDLTEVRAVNKEHCIDLFLEGNKRRNVASTNMNANSSRSHTLLRLRIESKVVAESRMEETRETLRTVGNKLKEIQKAIFADRVSLFLVDRAANELFINTGDIVLRLPMGQGIVGQCAERDTICNIPDAYKDKRFDTEVDKHSHYRTKSILAIPVKQEGEVVGVVEFFNKNENQGGIFNTEDEETVLELTKEIAPLLALALASGQTSISSCLNLVDLAGSERVSKTGAQGSVLKEAVFINTSLMMLGSCIALLAEGKEQHIPFRNSKLTHLLSTSLGGNTNTCIIGAISPAIRNRHESVSTCQFLTRAKTIVNRVSKNFSTDHSELMEAYKIEIANLKAELERMGSAISCVSNTSALGQSASNCQLQLLEGDNMNVVDVELSNNFSQRMKDLEAVAVEVRTLLDEVCVSQRIRFDFQVLVAVHASGKGTPDLVVSLSRFKEEIQSDGVSDASDDLVDASSMRRKNSEEPFAREWITEASLCALLDTLKERRNAEKDIQYDDVMSMLFKASANAADEARKRRSTILEELNKKISMPAITVGKVSLAAARASGFGSLHSEISHIAEEDGKEQSLAAKAFKFAGSGQSVSFIKQSSDEDSLEDPCQGSIPVAATSLSTERSTVDEMPMVNEMLISSADNMPSSHTQSSDFAKESPRSQQRESLASVGTTSSISSPRKQSTTMAQRASLRAKERQAKGALAQVSGGGNVNGVERTASGRRRSGGMSPRNLATGQPSAPRTDVQRKSSGGRQRLSSSAKHPGDIAKERRSNAGAGALQHSEVPVSPPQLTIPEPQAPVYAEPIASPLQHALGTAVDLAMLPADAEGDYGGDMRSASPRRRSPSASGRVAESSREFTSPREVTVPGVAATVDETDPEIVQQSIASRRRSPSPGLRPLDVSRQPLGHEVQSSVISTPRRVSQGSSPPRQGRMTQMFGELHNLKAELMAVKGLVKQACTPRDQPSSSNSVAQADSFAEGLRGCTSTGDTSAISDNMSSRAGGSYVVHSSMEPRHCGSQHIGRGCVSPTSPSKPVPPLVLPGHSVKVHIGSPTSGWPVSGGPLSGLAHMSLGGSPRHHHVVPPQTAHSARAVLMAPSSPMQTPRQHGPGSPLRDLGSSTGSYLVDQKLVASSPRLGSPQHSFSYMGHQSPVPQQGSQYAFLRSTTSPLPRVTVGGSHSSSHSSGILYCPNAHQQLVQHRAVSSNHPSGTAFSSSLVSAAVASAGAHAALQASMFKGYQTGASATASGPLLPTAAPRIVSGIASAPKERGDQHSGAAIRDLLVDTGSAYRGWTHVQSSHTHGSQTHR
eukprot:TRINITY_DN21882_c0_g1_i1.p1 TRINITY_DN21882_c0_g1~~TRINITY_DN21882_c0_g1_i1.p1  ORF type:complete len:1567 (-),score=266.22 TRINITY_DN21882_c0_g1_i1:133-4644(-)